MYVAKRSPNPPPWEQGGREGGVRTTTPPNVGKRAQSLVLSPPPLVPKVANCFQQNIKTQLIRTWWAKKMFSSLTSGMLAVVIYLLFSKSKVFKKFQKMRFLGWFSKKKHGFLSSFGPISSFLSVHKTEVFPSHPQFRESGRPTYPPPSLKASHPWLITAVVYAIAFLNACWFLP